MVSILPLYHPLRLIEETGMLDQLSHGRLELGIGRGASPFEIGMFGVQPSATRAMLEEALKILRIGLTGNSIEFEGQHYQIHGARTSVPSVQQPYPPLWYPTARAESVPWAARHGLNFLDAFVSAIAGSSMDGLGLVALYEQEYARQQDAPDRLNAHVPDPLHGFIRHIVVADSDAAANAIAHPAFERFSERFNQLWLDRAGRVPLRMNYHEFTDRGFLLAGTSATVAGELARQQRREGGNYVVGVFAFGDMATTDALTSMHHFARDVVPRISASPIA
jgi:alkanesulfonate monooxygenase SsuD/methylene tetrahydromethanopterin reductase-like flavin-dependent oxidoreductase (luciferase family)